MELTRWCHHDGRTRARKHLIDLISQQTQQQQLQQQQQQSVLRRRTQTRQDKQHISTTRLALTSDSKHCNTMADRFDMERPFGMLEEENKVPDVSLPYYGKLPEDKEEYRVTLKMSEVRACRTTQTIFGNQTEHTVFDKFAAMNKLGAKLHRLRPRRTGNGLMTPRSHSH